MPAFRVVQRTGSTNTDLIAAASADPGQWPHLSVLLAREQTAGKGRAGRTWTSTTIRSLTFSVLLRPSAPRQRWGWLPLVAGLAVVRTLRARADQPDRIALKWPNDVIDHNGGPPLAGWGTWRKLGGILTEVVPAGDAAVAGIGLNVEGPELPVEWAGTLAAAGVGEIQHDDDMDALAQAITTELGRLITAFDDGGELRGHIAQVCATLGQQVHADQPGGSAIQGIAVELADDGGLVVRSGGTEHTIRAGDVRRLRAGD
ncbi:MAG TPA: biotin--[acetyl-CoA-carboxylase] ligase [Beutenbergiaceae bacterium]|nr:biotin--[acetyl-CoA-carboxylase] ligase [Beutenbergiaceae bacterium]